MNKPNYFQLTASVMLMALFFLPLWKITLTAPQYPTGISLFIWINKITGDNEFTLQNINILNHYVGMKSISPNEFPEFKVIPYIVIAMAAIGSAASFTKNKKLVLIWLIALVILSCAGIYDLYLWEYEYGHNLDPRAPIKIPGMAYQPPLLGSKTLLNFKADSYPNFGGVILGISIILSGFSIFKKKK